MSTSPKPRASRHCPPSSDEIGSRQFELGELRRLATVARPDIGARLAKTASRINSLCGSDLYRIGELVRAGKEWGRAKSLKYASPSRPWKSLGFDGKAINDMRNKGGSYTVERCY